MRLGFGEGTAPVLHGDVLIRTSITRATTFIVALDKATGRELWRKAREEESTLVCAASDRARRQDAGDRVCDRLRKSYDIATGDELWQCGGLG
ncbi:MAG: hypothetical protein R2748_26020 [Bryobacterales bacterium]